MSVVRASRVLTCYVETTLIIIPFDYKLLYQCRLDVLLHPKEENLSRLGLRKGNLEHEAVQRQQAKERGSRECRLRQIDVGATKSFGLCSSDRSSADLACGSECREPI